MSFLKNPTVRLWLSQLILALLAVALFVFLVLQLLKIWTHHGEYTVVPDLSKMTLSQVESTLEDAKLRYEVLDSTSYNPDYPKYSVIGQNPEPASKVKENRKIYLTINPSGYRKVTVPRVIQITRRSAEATLKAVGLEIGKVTYVDNIGKDMVLEMKHKGKDIIPGDKIVKMSKIDLVCGNGVNPLLPKELTQDDLSNTSVEGNE